MTNQFWPLSAHNINHHHPPISTSHSQPSSRNHQYANMVVHQWSPMMIAGSGGWFNDGWSLVALFPLVAGPWRTMLPLRSAAYSMINLIQFWWLWLWTMDYDYGYDYDNYVTMNDMIKRQLTHKLILSNKLLVCWITLIELNFIMSYHLSEKLINQSQPLHDWSLRLGLCLRLRATSLLI